MLDMFGIAFYEPDTYSKAQPDDALRREGIATTLIESLQALGAVRSTYVIFLQADYGDDPAIQFYPRLGVREDVLHFDIDVNQN